MRFPGRNEPCRCGSGKKYKKCCLEKDSATAILAAKTEQTQEQWEAESDDLMPLNQIEQAYENDWNDAADDELITDNDEINKEHIEFENDLISTNSVRENITNSPYPEISAADEKLVDDWWEGLDYDWEPMDIRKYIETFMQAYPQLVENLGLEEEVLFELGDSYRKNGALNEYIDFLFFIRKEFPGTYIRSAGFYDADIIAWLITQNRPGEIDNYLGYLKEYPIQFIDQLFGVVKLFQATDYIAPLIELASATYKKITTSNEIFGGDKIVDVLVSDCMSKYLQMDVRDIDVPEFMSELSILIDPVSVDINDVSLKYWQGKFNHILQPFTYWPENIPKKKSQIEERYDTIVHNYTAYLHKRTGISWVSSFYYSTQLNNYFREYLELTNGKIKIQFDFTSGKIDNIVGALSKEMMWVNCTKCMSILHAIYHFAAYLRECGNISEQNKSTIQKDCKKLYNDIYPSLKSQSSEAICFYKFPLF